MIEAMIVLLVLNLGLGGYNYVLHKKLETIVMFGNYPSNFPNDPRTESPKVRDIGPRAGGQIRKAPIARNDEELFEIENNTRKE